VRGPGAVATSGPVAVSVIIPCRGQAELLGGCLRGLGAQGTGRRFEVIVIDSAADEAVARTVAGVPDVRLVRGADELLPGEARNLGAAHASGDVLAFIDADCLPAPGWIEALWQGLAGGARLVGGPVDDLWPWHPVARIDNLLQFADLAPGRPAGPTHLIPSCNLALRHADFDRIGGFRHAGREPAGEDVDLCLRAAGLWPGALRFVPAMRIRHAGRRDLRAFLRHHWSFGHARGRGRLLLTPGHARLGRRASLIPAVVARRLLYIGSGVARWRPSALPVMLGLMPLIIAGLVAWALGLRRGLRRAGRAGRSSEAAPRAGRRA